MVTVSPNLMGAIFLVMRRLHPCDRRIGTDAFCKIETVIRRFERARAGPFPFMCIADTFAHGPAYESGFPGAHPDDRIFTGDVGELELIDTCLGVLGLLLGRVIEGRHVRGAADLCEGRALIVDGQLAELLPSLLGCYGMAGYHRISLADIRRVGEDLPDPLHLGSR